MILSPFADLYQYDFLYPSRAAVDHNHDALLAQYDPSKFFSQLYPKLKALADSKRATEAVGKRLIEVDGMMASINKVRDKVILFRMQGNLPESF